jgi:competence protein ComEC
MAAMIVSQVLSFPLIIAHFYQYAWLSGPVNVIFSPIYSAIVLPISTLSLLISFVSLTWGSWLAQVIAWVMDVLDRCLTWIATLPKMTYSFSPPSVGWIICFFVVAWFVYALIVTDRLSLRRYRYGALVVLLALIGVLIGRNGTSITMLTVIDVGQGDALLLETAEGKVILIDGGGTLPSVRTNAWQRSRSTFEVGRDVVVPYLRYRGINHIDVIVMTHGDSDHIRGLKAVLERISVGEVWHSGMAPVDAFERQLLRQIQEKHIPIHMVQAGVQLPIEDGIHISMLHPVVNVSNKNSNDRSIVMLLQLYQTNMLLTGDIEQAAEQEVMKNYDLPSIQLLKVAHHGSKTSTTEDWLMVTKPQEALISVGRHNRYGHPHAEVIARLHQIGARIWRTDTDGAIMIFFDRNGYRINSEVKR